MNQKLVRVELDDKEECERCGRRIAWKKEVFLTAVREATSTWIGEENERS